LKLNYSIKKTLDSHSILIKFLQESSIWVMFVIWLRHGVWCEAVNGDDKAELVKFKLGCTLMIGICGEW